MTGFQHLGCAACGSTLGLREGQRLVRCTHCGSEFLAVVPGFVARFRVAPVLDAKAADAVVRRALKHPEVERGMAKDAKVGRPELYWVPFYEVDGLQVSTYVEKKGGRPDTRLCFVDYQAQGCAEALSEWGLSELRPRALRQRASLPLLPAVAEDLSRTGHVLPAPPIPLAALTPNEPVATKHEIVASGSKLIGVERRYVYHPVWRVGVQDGKHPYGLVVDGVSGELLSGRLPQDRRMASLWLLVTLAFFALVLGRSLHFSFRLDHLLVLFELWTIVLPVVGTLISMLFIALAVFWSETRFRGEVVFSRQGASVEKLGRPPETKLERWAAQVGRTLERLIEAQTRLR